MFYPGIWGVFVVTGHLSLSIYRLECGLRSSFYLSDLAAPLSSQYGMCVGVGITHVCLLINTETLKINSLGCLIWVLHEY